MFFELIGIWLLLGCITALLVTIKPPQDTPGWWPVPVIAIGPIGLLYFCILTWRCFRRDLR